jgi:hypothetical protein
MEILLQPRVAAVEPTGKNSFLKNLCTYMQDVLCDVIEHIV